LPRVRNLQSWSRAGLEEIRRASPDHARSLTKDEQTPKQPEFRASPERSLCGRAPSRATEKNDGEGPLLARAQTADARIARATLTPIVRAPTLKTFQHSDASGVTRPT
jgi:hypothetical protein